MLQLQQHERTFQELKTQIVAVTFEATAFARAYVEETRLRWPILTDETRELYRAYRMLAGTSWDVLGPSSWWVYLKELTMGELPKRPGSDIFQLGGDVLIDPAGTVRFHHVGRGPADRPTVDTLLRARTARP